MIYFYKLSTYSSFTYGLAEIKSSFVFFKEDISCFSACTSTLNLEISFSFSSFSNSSIDYFSSITHYRFSSVVLLFAKSSSFFANL